jgi:hypothetical protein
MKSIDVKSLLIGFLLCAVGVLSIGASDSKLIDMLRVQNDLTTSHNELLNRVFALEHVVKKIPSTGSPQASSSGVGRYQISSNNAYIFLVDTKSGTAYSQTSGPFTGKWEEHITF